MKKEPKSEENLPLNPQNLQELIQNHKTEQGYWVDKVFGNIEHEYWVLKLPAPQQENETNMLGRRLQNFIAWIVVFAAFLWALCGN